MNLGRSTQEQIRPSPQVSVGSEIGRIPLNPQRPSRARSTESHSRVKYVVPFVDLNFLIFPISSPDAKSQNLIQSYLVPLIKFQKIEVNLIS